MARNSIARRNATVIPVIAVRQKNEKSLALAFPAANEKQNNGQPVQHKVRGKSKSKVNDDIPTATEKQNSNQPVQHVS